MNLGLVAVVLAASSIAEAAPPESAAEQTVTLQPRRGKGLLIGAAVSGGIGLVAGCVGLLAYQPTGLVSSSTVGGLVAAFSSAVVGGTLILMAAIMTVVGIVQWRSSAPPAPPPDENLRLSAFTPKQAPAGSLVTWTALRF